MGSLAEALSCIAKNEMNLTKIQSFPKIGKSWEYFFYADVLFNNEEDFQFAFDNLKLSVNELYCLGKYKNNLVF